MFSANETNNYSAIRSNSLPNIKRKIYVKMEKPKVPVYDEEPKGSIKVIYDILSKKQKDIKEINNLSFKNRRSTEPISRKNKTEKLNSSYKEKYNGRNNDSDSNSEFDSGFIKFGFRRRDT
jgi:hypothetical protein